MKISIQAEFKKVVQSSNEHVVFLRCVPLFGKSVLVSEKDVLVSKKVFPYQLPLNNS